MRHLLTKLFHLAKYLPYILIHTHIYTNYIFTEIKYSRELIEAVTCQAKQKLKWWQKKWKDERVTSIKMVMPKQFTNWEKARKETWVPCCLCLSKLRRPKSFGLHRLHICIWNEICKRCTIWEIHWIQHTYTFLFRYVLDYMYCHNTYQQRHISMHAIVGAQHLIQFARAIVMAFR